MVLGHHGLIKWGLANKLIAPSASVVLVSSEAQRLGAIHNDITKDIHGEVTTGCKNQSPLCIPAVPLEADQVGLESNAGDTISTSVQSDSPPHATPDFTRWT